MAAKKDIKDEAELDLDKEPEDEEVKTSNLINYFNLHVCLYIHVSMCLKTSSNSCSYITKCH